MCLYVYIHVNIHVYICVCTDTHASIKLNIDISIKYILRIHIYISLEYRVGLAVLFFRNNDDILLILSFPRRRKNVTLSKSQSLSAWSQEQLFKVSLEHQGRKSRFYFKCNGESLRILCRWVTFWLYFEKSILVA